MRKMGLLLLCFGLLLTLYYARAYATTCVEFCGALHGEIVSGTADSPHRYRILAAFAVETIFHPRTDLNVAISYIAAHALALPAMLITLFLWFRRWVTEIAALAGVLLIAAYSPIMFAVYGIALYNPLEVILLCGGLLWLLNRRDGVVFAALIALATLNRETGVLLVLAYGAVHLSRWRERPFQIKLLLYGALWAGIYLGLRLWRGAAPDMVSLQGGLNANLGDAWVSSEALINNAVLIPVWLAAWQGFRHAPRDLRRIALVGVPYLLLLIPFALWNETRLLLPLFALWLPLALIGFAPTAALPRKSA